MSKHRLIAFGVVVLAVLSICIALGLSGNAKRSRRPVVMPVEISGVQYRAPNTVETEGCIEAWDIKSNSLLWRRKVYHTWWVPFFERDNQWVFIKSMKVAASGNELIIINEDERHYTVKTTPSTSPSIGAVISVGILLCGTLMWFRRKFSKSRI